MSKAIFKRLAIVSLFLLLSPLVHVVHGVINFKRFNDCDDSLIHAGYDFEILIVFKR